MTTVFVEANDAIDFMGGEQVTVLPIPETAFRTMELPESLVDHDGKWLAKSRKGPCFAVEQIGHPRPSIRQPSNVPQAKPCGTFRLPRSAAASNVP